MEEIDVVSPTATKVINHTPFKENGKKLMSLSIHYVLLFCLCLKELLVLIGSDDIQCISFLPNSDSFKQIDCFLSMISVLLHVGKEIICFYCLAADAILLNLNSHTGTLIPFHASGDTSNVNDSNCKYMCDQC